MFLMVRTLFRSFSNRFVRLFVLLYSALLLGELSRAALIYFSHSAQYVHFPVFIFGPALLTEFAARPYLAIPLLLWILFNVWGTVSFYFLLAGAPFQEALNKGFKNLLRYIGFFLLATSITILGIFAITVPVFSLLNRAVLLPPLFDSAISFLTTFPLFLLTALPGIYFLVVFAIGPFILLLEQKSIVASLRESRRRLSIKLSENVLFLLVSFLFAILIYYVIDQLISYIPLYQPLIFQIFLYQLPWVVAMIFFDLAVFMLYQKTGISQESTPPVTLNLREEKKENTFNVSFTTTEIIAIILCITVFASATFTPAPVYAGNVFKILFNLVMLVASCLTTYCIGWVVMTAAQAAVCGGRWNFAEGSCNYEQGKQEIFTPRNVRFLEVNASGVPSPGEFRSNPNTPATVNIKWKGDAPTGILELLRVTDSTGKVYASGAPDSGQRGISCREDTSQQSFTAPYETTIKAEIVFVTCMQVKGGKHTRSIELFCTDTGKGCGDFSYRGFKNTAGTLARYVFNTPAYPNVKADLKANGSDKPLTPASVNKPVALSWSSDYATSCTASGSWSGSKGVTGSQTVTPITGSEAYRLTCNRGDKSTNDVIDFGVPPGPSSIPGAGGSEFHIFPAGGGLHISAFNASQPLNPGDTVLISWNVEGASSCSIDNGIGPVATKGAVEVTFVHTQTFKLTCTDSAGNSASAEKTIDVKKVPPFREVKPQ